MAVVGENFLSTCRLFEDYYKPHREQVQPISNEKFAIRVSPTDEFQHNNGFSEALYDAEKEHQPLMGKIPTAPKISEHANGTLKIGTNGYPGPPSSPPKQNWRHQW